MWRLRGTKTGLAARGQLFSKYRHAGLRAANAGVGSAAGSSAPGTGRPGFPGGTPGDGAYDSSRFLPADAQRPL